MASMTTMMPHLKMPLNTNISDPAIVSIARVIIRANVVFDAAAAPPSPMNVRSVLQKNNISSEMHKIKII